MTTENRTVLAEVSGFTPLIDSLIPAVGYITAGIFGVIWRYCQMQDGICRASNATLAQKLGLSRRSIMRHINKLVAAGYLIDETPDAKDKPHRLRDTGKAGLKIKIEAEISPQGVTQSHTTCDSESHLPVTESHTMIHIKRQKNISNSRGKPRDPLLDHPAILAYRGITHNTPNSTQRELIAAAVGKDESEVNKWKKILTEWVGHGWNPHNVTSQLEAYRNGFQTHTRKENGNGQHGKAAGQPSIGFDEAGQRSALDAIQKRARERVAPIVPALSKTA